MNDPSPWAKEPPEVAARKQELRVWALARRGEQPDPDAVSLEIARRLLGFPEFLAARAVMSYVDMRTEVRTGAILDAAWRMGKRLYVPWCAPGYDILPYCIEGREELEPGTFGVLEPAGSVRAAPERLGRIEDLDLIVVPGLAFDPQGRRIGYGKGYYDNFLRRATARTLVVALAYQCQLAERVPATGHDIPVDLVLTESSDYRSAARRPAGP